MLHLRNILPIVLILIASYINAQNVKWTLEKCITYAKENNLQIKQAGYDAEIARTNLNTAKNAYLPEANANASQQYYMGRSVNPYTYTFSNNNNNSGNFSLNGSVALFKGFQRRYDIKQSNFTLQAVLMDIEKAKNDLSLNITSVFLELLFYDELIRNDSSQLRVTENQMQMADEMVKSGVKTESYLYDFKTQQAQDYYNLIQDKNNYQTKLIELIQLLEFKSPDDFEIEKPDKLDILNKPDSLNSYYNLALTTLPQVKSAKFRLQSAESNIEYTKGYWYPVLSFNTSLNSGYSSNSLLFDATRNKIDYPYNKQVNDNVNMYYGLSLTVPIFNRFQVRNSISTANYNKLKAEAHVELVQKQIYKDVQKSYYDVIAANEKMASTKVLLDATELSFKYADEKLKAGIISVYDYSTMKTKLAKAISDYLQTKYEYIFKMKILDFYAGKPITLENQ